MHTYIRPVPDPRHFGVQRWIGITLLKAPTLPWCEENVSLATDHAVGPALPQTQKHEWSSRYCCTSTKNRVVRGTAKVRGEEPVAKYSANHLIIPSAWFFFCSCIQYALLFLQKREFITFIIPFISFFSFYFLFICLLHCTSINIYIFS